MPTKNKNTGAKIWLIISQIFILLTLLPWLAMFGLSFMAFDAGISFTGILFVLTIGSYPILCILLSIFAWKAYNRQNIQKAVILGSIPIVLAMIFLILIL
ncbi:MAG: hypothetical protein AABW92_01545 [Nanoarchaeota archaeon]